MEEIVKDLKEFEQEFLGTYFSVQLKGTAERHKATDQDFNMVFAEVFLLL